VLTIRPITLRAANEYVAAHHRHNQPTRGHKWSLALYDGERLCGVAIAGQPIARKLDDGLTIEVRRLCTDGTKDACSKLYGACARVAKEMGYRKIITYTLISEPGTSLRASGWTNCGEAGGGMLERTIPPTGGRANHHVRNGAEVPGRKENQMGENAEW
jgi:hypothetical protein